MPPDKFAAVWVSHTSINDFRHCPRAYYLKNIYRDPKTNHKIKVMSPPLALGQAVHEVVESLSILPVEKRFSGLLMDKFDIAWENVSGKKGGFTNDTTEAQYKSRGREMIARVVKNPGPLVNRAVKIKSDLPYYWLSEEDNIILCGKIDWLEYLPATDSIHIIDFKTSKRDEDPESLQLPIYYLLATHCQHRRVSKISYWYLARDDECREMQIPDIAKSEAIIMDFARQMKVARQLRRFKCSHDGCSYCRPFEEVIAGHGEFVYVDSYKADVYILHAQTEELEDMSEIL